MCPPDGRPFSTEAVRMLLAKASIAPVPRKNGALPRGAITLILAAQARLIPAIIYFSAFFRCACCVAPLPGFSPILAPAPRLLPGHIAAGYAAEMPADVPRVTRAGFLSPEVVAREQ